MNRETERGMMRERPLCVVASRHEENKTPLATPGLLVCSGHRTKLERLLAELPALADDLLLAHSLGAGGMHDKVDVSADPGLRFNPDVAEARDQIHHDLVWWVKLVAGERGLREPVDTIPALATFLVTHVDWLCAQACVVDCHDTFDLLVNGDSHLGGGVGQPGVRSLAFPNGKRRIGLHLPDGTPARCIESNAAVVSSRRPVGRCLGVLMAVVAPQDDLLPSWIECSFCQVRVEAPDWYLWGQRAVKLLRVA